MHRFLEKNFRSAFIHSFFLQVFGFYVKAGLKQNPSDMKCPFSLSRDRIYPLRKASDHQSGYPLGDQQVLMVPAIAPTGLLSFRSFVISGVTQRNLANL